MSRTELIQKTNRMTNRRRMTKRNLSKTATRTRTRRTVASRTAASDLPARGRQYQRTGTVLASQSLSEPGDSKEKLTRYRRSITSNHNIIRLVIRVVNPIVTFTEMLFALCNVRQTGLVKNARTLL